MNKQLKRIALAICLVVLVAGCTVKPPTLAENQLPIDSSLSSEHDLERDCWAVGDSIFMGTSAYDVGTAHYMPGTRMVAVHGTPVLAIEGTGGKSIRTQLRDAIKIFGWPECVVIQAAGWDLAYRIGGMTPPIEQYQAEISYINTQLTINGVEVFWTNIIPLLAHGPFWTQQNHRVALNTWMDQEFGDHSVNCSAALTNSELDYFVNLQRLLIDGLHPSNQAARDMAYCIADATALFGYDVLNQ